MGIVGRAVQSASDGHQPGLSFELVDRKGLGDEASGALASPVARLQWVTLSCWKLHFC